MSESGGSAAGSGVGSPPQAGRMRRRFHELLDDAFSLFAGSRSGSRSASQDEDESPPPTGEPAGSPPGPPAAGLQISSVLDRVLPAQQGHDPRIDHRVQSAVQRYQLSILHALKQTCRAGYLQRQMLTAMIVLYAPHAAVIGTS